MCVKPIHTCLFIGMLMPAMRAMLLYLSACRRRGGAPPVKRGGILRVPGAITKSPLPLLVARVAADDIDHAPAAHDLAVLADLLDRRTYFHELRSTNCISPPTPSGRSRADS